MRKTVLSSLKEARRLITPKKNWGKVFIARNKWGTVVGWQDIDAVRFCLLGAVQRACNSRESKLKEACLKQLRKFCPTIWLTDYNDSNTHKDVLALFDKAIADCGKRIRKHKEE